MTSGTLFLFVLILLLTATESDFTEVKSFGSTDGSADHGIPGVGTSFLLQKITVSGVLFAVSAYFVECANSTFQIWRPLDDNTSAIDKTVQRFKLIWEMTATPSKAMSREDIYMEAKFLKMCARVRPNDWFGVVQPSRPTAIGAPFVTNTPVLPKMDENTASNGNTVGMEANFEMKFTYPFKPLSAVYILTDPNLFGANSSDERIDCPSGVLIPSWINASSITTVPTVTFIPGATGATGQMGIKGPNGATGATGMQGVMGAKGPVGLVGLTGMTGATGPPGSVGDMGNRGTKGFSGALGPPGPSGLEGDTGQTGPQGLPGNDTYFYESQPQPLPLQSTDTETDGGLGDREDLRMGAIIWLAILSAIAVTSTIALIFVCYFVADDRRVQKNEAAWIGSEVSRR